MQLSHIKRPISKNEKTYFCFLQKDESKSLVTSRVRLFMTPWTVAYQAPPSMGFSRKEYWSGLPFPSPEDLPDPGTEPRFPTLWTDALPSEPPGKSFADYMILCIENPTLSKNC